MRSDRFIEASCETVVVGDGLAGETTGTEANAAEEAERSFAGEGEIIQAEAAKDLIAVGSAVVYASVEAVLVVGTGARAGKIVNDTRGGWLRKSRQDVGGLRGNSSDGDEVSGKRSASGAVCWIAG